MPCCTHGTSFARVCNCLAAGLESAALGCRRGIDMPVSRRGFLRMIDSRGAMPVSGAFLSARGLEAYLAEAQTQGRRAKPLLPPGVEEIRISSNENPLGPGRPALDGILRKFPEAGRYPFNSTPSDT